MERVKPAKRDHFQNWSLDHLGLLHPCFAAKGEDPSRLIEPCMTLSFVVVYTSKLRVRKGKDKNHTGELHPSRPVIHDQVTR